MEEIDIKDLLNYFWNKKAMIVMITLLCLFVGFMYSGFFQKPRYQSATTIVLTRVNDVKAEEGGITQNDVLLNQKLVSTYREIVKSRRILNQVVNNLELEETASELSKRVNVTNEKDTELLRITVVDRDPKKAKDIANEIAHVFSSEIVEIYSIKNVSIIDYAETPTVPYNIHILKQIVLSGLIGIVLSMGIVFVMFYFDTTIKSTDEVEQKLGLPILGAVPFSHRKGGKK